MSDQIQAQPGKRGGQPCIRDTRITVSDVLGWLKSGMKWAEIMSDFPELKEHDIKAAIKHVQPFKIGDPVLITGCTCKYRTNVGLFGYVEKIWIYEGHEPQFYVKFLTRPDLNTQEHRAEVGGHFDTNGTGCSADQIELLIDPVRVARVMSLKAVDDAEKARPQTPDDLKSRMKIKRLMADLDDPKKREKERLEKEAIAAEHLRIGQVFKLPNFISRTTKYDYPSWYQPEFQAASEEIRGYASCDKVSDLPLEKRARWEQALRFTDQACFWPNRDEIRSIVAELDLDPHIDEFSYALWRDIDHLFIKAGHVRAEVFRLWNEGAQILRIQEMKDDQHCWREEDGEPPGYQVTYGFRRQLPIRHANEDPKQVLPEMLSGDEPLLSKPERAPGRSAEGSTAAA